MTTRREFINAALAAGVCPSFASAVAAMPASGPEVLKFMKLTRRTINLGLKRPFSVVHISDTHLVRVAAEDLAVMDGKAIDWYERRREAFPNAIKGLAAAIAYARSEHLPILHTGDLIDFASRAAFAEIALNFKEVDWFYACGNHEYHGWNGGTPAIYQGPSKAERDQARAAYEKLLPNPIAVASRVIGGVNFVAYDNGGYSDYLGHEQFAAVKRELAKGLPVVLLAHMPFWSPAIGEMIVKTHPGTKLDSIATGHVQGRPDKPNWGGRLEMTEYLRKAPGLKAILCGHLHHDFIDEFSPQVKQYVADANYAGAVYRYDFV